MDQGELQTIRREPNSNKLVLSVTLHPSTLFTVIIYIHTYTPLHSTSSLLPPHRKKDIRLLPVPGIRPSLSNNPAWISANS